MKCELCGRKGAKVQVNHWIMHDECFEKFEIDMEKEFRDLHADPETMQQLKELKEIFSKIYTY